MRRVVITGVGLVTPLGVGVKHTWPRLLASQSGIKPTTTLPDPAFAQLPSRIAGLVPRGPTSAGGWTPLDHISKSEERSTALFSQYALAAAEEAITDACLLPLSTQESRNTGVVIGSGIGNLSEQHKQSLSFTEHGHHKTHPLYVPRTLINMAAAHIAMRHGFMGPNLAPSTACTTGLHALIEGVHLIQTMNVNTVIAGSSESCIHPLAISGFARARSLSTGFNHTPERASRPFDTQRDGFVIGEGAGVVVLEDRTRALERGAKIYGEVTGIGMSCDASHLTAPRSDGLGAKMTIERALTKTAARRTERLGSAGYVNAHATGTGIGDAVENKAVREVLGALTGTADDPRAAMWSMSSTKGATGHLLGAAGAVEAIFSLLAMCDGVVPPTLNLDRAGDARSPSDEGASGEIENQWDLDYVPHTAKERDVDVALTNSFGFGGTNASVCFVKGSEGLEGEGDD